MQVREVIFQRKQKEICDHLQSVFTTHLVLIPHISARPMWENSTCTPVISLPSQLVRF